MTERFCQVPDHRHCERAAIASLLDLPLDEVPHVFDGGASSIEVDAHLRNWMASRGLYPISCAFSGEIELDVMLAHVETLNPGLRFLLTGKSRNGTGHRVVAGQGKILWDPSLDQSGIVGPCPEDGFYWMTFLGSLLPIVRP